MADEQIRSEVVDTVTLRFNGEDENGVELHELRASHVGEVLQGLVGLTGDFDRAGVFHDEGPTGSEILVRPPRQGSFIIEVVRVVSENWEVVKSTEAVVGVPTVGTLVWWATKSVRAGVKDFDYLENGKVKIIWGDDTAEEVPLAAWQELNKRRRRRKKQLRQIMAPLADQQVTSLDLNAPNADDENEADTSEPVRLVRADYDAARPDDEVVEKSEILEVEGRMSAIDFDDSSRWRVKTSERTRNVTVEDQRFLRQVAQGLAIRQQDVFSLRIREDSTRKNGRTTTKWTALTVTIRGRAASDSDSQEPGATSTP